MNEEENYQHPNDENVLSQEHSTQSGFFPPAPETVESPEAGESNPYNPRSAGLKKEETKPEEAPKMEVKLDKETIDLIRASGQQVPQQKKQESDEAYHRRVLEKVQPFAVDKDTAKFLLRMDEEDEVDDEVLNRMQGFVNKIVRNASGLARHQMEAEFAELREAIQPMASNYQQQQHEQTAQQFLTSYSHLQNYQPLVQLAITQLQQEGFNGNPDVVYAKVAERAEQLGATMGINFEKGQPNSQQVSQQVGNPSAPRKAVPTMAGMSRGGRTASSGQSQVNGGTTFIDPWRRKPITT